MTEGFDPYHKWLGIPPEEQPPNHYRLLAVSLFESDPDVIDAAASKQVAYLRTCATGPHVALSQKILNEIAAARLCLLDQKKKAAYDEELRGRLGVGVASKSTAGGGQSPVNALAAPLRTTEAAVGSAKPVVTAVRQKHQNLPPWLVYAAVGAGALALVVLLAVIMSEPGSDEVARSDQQVPPANQPAHVADADPVDVPSQKEAPTTPSEGKLVPLQQDEEEVTSPNQDDPSLQEPSSTNPTLDTGDETDASGKDEEPVDAPDTQVVPSIPPLPVDAEEQLKNGLAEAQSHQDFRAVAEKAFRYVDQAIVANDAETAKQLATLAVAAAREAKDDELSKTATLRYLEVQGPLTEDVIEGARRRLGTWKPHHEAGGENEATDSSPALLPSSNAPQRSLGDLVK